MHNLSMTQALSLWNELEKAYYDDNSYGGTEAEIYVIAALPYTGMWHRDGPLADEWNPESAKQANTSLCRLFEKFAKDRECTVLVGGEPVGDWMIESDNRHRWHVEVVR